MFKHFPVTDGLTVMIRSPFRLRADKDGNPIPERKSGELAYVAEVVAGGFLRSAFADSDQAAALRLKVVGHEPPEFIPGNVVRLHDAHLSCWYNPRQRGNDASSAATLSAGRVELAPGASAVMSGGLPGHDRGISALLLSTGETCELMFSPEGIFAVDGVGQVRVAAAPKPELVGQAVTLHGVKVFYTVPDSADVGRTAKAELIVRCASISPAATSNGRANRKSDPEPVAVEG